MTNEPVFTIGKAVQKGWEMTKEYLGFLIVYQIVLYILVALFASSHYGFGGKLLGLAGWVLIVLAKMGFYNSMLLIINQIKPTFAQFYQNWRLFLSWIVANFLFGIMVVIGLIFFIVPGCYFIGKYGLFPFFLLDKNLGPIEALKQAGNATKGLRWHIFLLFLACLGINILGLLLLGIGLLFTVPITLGALASVYKSITRISVDSIDSTN